VYVSTTVIGVAVSVLFTVSSYGVGVHVGSNFIVYESVSIMGVTVIVLVRVSVIGILVQEGVKVTV